MNGTAQKMGYVYLVPIHFTGFLVAENFLPFAGAPFVTPPKDCGDFGKFNTSMQLKMLILPTL